MSNTARSVAAWAGYEKKIKGQVKGVYWDQFCNLLEKSGYTDNTVDDTTLIDSNVIFRIIFNSQSGNIKPIRDKLIEEVLIPLFEAGKLPEFNKIIESIPEVKPAVKRKPARKQSKVQIAVSPWED